MNIPAPEQIGTVPVEPDLVQGDPASPAAFNELKTGSAAFTPENIRNSIDHDSPFEFRVVQA